MVISGSRWLLELTQMLLATFERSFESDFIERLKEVTACLLPQLPDL
jgi:hypothetical protein